MDDESKYYTIQIKGKAYRFKPMTPEAMERVVIIVNMNASHGKSLKALTGVLSEAAGAQQWDELTDLLLESKVTLREITVDLFERLMKRQVKDVAKTSADAE